MYRRFVAPLVFAGIVALVAACGPEAESPAAVATGSPATSSSAHPAQSATTSAPFVSPTPSPIYVYTGFVLGAADEPINADDTSASGCTPGAGALPDGVWGGLVSDWRNPSSLEFDLECVYGPMSMKVEAAKIACLARTGASEMCQTSTYVENSSSTLRSVPLATGATLIYQDSTATWREVPIAEAPPEVTANAIGGPADHVWWIYVNGGTITQVFYDPFPG